MAPGGRGGERRRLSTQPQGMVPRLTGFLQMYRGLPNKGVPSIRDQKGCEMGNAPSKREDTPKRTFELGTSSLIVLVTAIAAASAIVGGYTGAQATVTVRKVQAERDVTEHANSERDRVLKDIRKTGQDEQEVIVKLKSELEKNIAVYEAQCGRSRDDYTSAVAKASDGFTRQVDSEKHKFIQEAWREGGVVIAEIKKSGEAYRLQVEESQVPVGGILPFYHPSLTEYEGDQGQYAEGQVEKIHEYLPRNWVLCDGRVLDNTHPRGLTLNDVDENLWGKRVPDFRGRVARGATAAERVGSESGSNQIIAHPTQGAGEHNHTVNKHTHPLSGRTGKVTNEGDDPGMDEYKVRDDHQGFTNRHHFDVGADHKNNEGHHYHYLEGSTGDSEPGTSAAAAHTHQVAAIPHVPSYTAVYFVIRIK